MDSSSTASTISKLLIMPVIAPLTKEKITTPKIMFNTAINLSKVLVPDISP